MKTYLNPLDRIKWNHLISNEKASQISPLLFDSLSKNPIIINNDFSIQVARNQIQTFIDTLGLIILLGEAEHSGDWDPYIKIKLGNGDEIESLNGYYDMEIQDNETLILYNSEDETNGIGHHEITIENIHSIQLLR